MSKFKGIVKWNSNHYSYGEEVKGSKVEIREDGTVWLYNDEEVYRKFGMDLTRNGWVELDQSYDIYLENVGIENLENENMLLRTKFAMYEDLLDNLNLMNFRDSDLSRIEDTRNKIKLLDKKCDGACEI